MVFAGRACSTAFPKVGLFKSRLPDPNSLVTSLSSRFERSRVSHLLPKIEKLDRFAKLR